MRSIEEWSKVITEYAIDHGFTWKKSDIDTLLLRIISEVIEASESARDIPIQKVLEIEIKEKHSPTKATMRVLVDEDGKFEQEGCVFKVRGTVHEFLVDINKEEQENFAVELADIFIRLANVAEVMGVDLEKEVEKKHAKNLKRSYRHGRKRK